tara:strand:- start:362 stop:5254 length:4893 start_codon:yes stop_codon:yes gene_type:complete
MPNGTQSRLLNLISSEQPSVQSTLPKLPSLNSESRLLSLMSTQEDYQEEQKDSRLLGLIRPEIPTFSEAFFSSFAEELTFGKLYNDPRLDADELPSGAKAGKMLGAGAAFFGVTALATVATGGLGGLAMLGSTGAKLTKGAQIYNKARKAGNVGGMAKGVAEAGIGTRNSLLLKALGKNGVQKGYIDKFMKIAEKDVGAARRFVLGREMGREALIFGATGQMMQEDDASFKQRAVAFGQDAAAGALFAVAPAFQFVNNPYIKSMGKSKSAELGAYFMSGFITSLPNENGVDLGSRVLTGALSTGVGKLFGGASITASKSDIKNALSRVGITNEQALSDYADISMGIINKNIVKSVDEFYKTVDFKSVTESVKEGKKFTDSGAKVLRVYLDKKDGLMKVDYQTLYKNGKVKDTATTSFNKFSKKYKRKDENLIQDIKHNLDSDGNNFSFFKNQKELETFLNTKKFGIVTANAPKYFSNKAIGLYGETRNEVLIRELLSRGYKRKDIMSSEGFYLGANDGRGFIVKGLKENDAVEIAKIFGQESVATHKGFLNVKRATRRVKKLENGQPIKDEKGNFVYENVGYKAGDKKNEITQVAYNLKKVIQNNIVYGKTAKKEDGFTSVYSQDGKKLHFSSKVDWDTDVGLRNPTMNQTQKLARADEILLESSKKIKNNTPERQVLYKEIKNLEVEAGIATRGKGRLSNTRHTEVKVNTFGKTSITQMTDDELVQYRNLIDNQPSYTTNLDDVNGGVVYDTGPLISGFQKALNRVLPISTKYGNLGRLLGSKELIKVEKDLDKMVQLKEELKGGYRAVRDEMKEGYDFHQLSKSEKTLVDKELLYHIDPNFSSLKSDLNKRQRAALDKALKLHKKYVKQTYRQMKNAYRKSDEIKKGVQEKVFDAKQGKFVMQDITEVDNFVSLTITEEAAELFSQQNGTLREEMLKNIIKTDKRFKRGGEFFEEALVGKKSQYEIAEEILDDTLSHSAKHGIYGAQYSRTGNLAPKIFLDADGSIISGVDNMKLKVGDEFNGTKIGKVIDVYIEDYGQLMDLYAGRQANITAATKYFGSDGIEVGGFASESFSKRIRQIEKELGNRKDIAYASDELLKDMDIVLRGDTYDDVVSPVLRQAVSWTAATGLSSPRSALKNIFLGQVQNITSFGVKKYLRTMGKMIGDSDFQDQVYKRAVKIGALDAGETFVETIGIRGQGIQARIQRNLTYFMRTAEQKNRLFSVAVGDIAADDALKILGNKTDGVFFQMDKSQARRVLDDVLKVDGWEKSVGKGFTEAQKNQIYFKAHTMTQGLAEAAYLPRGMSNTYAKPFTLFYRIAYRVTENVYKNAYRPLLENGEVAPMMRYVAASAGAGAAIQNMYYAVHNTDPVKFQSAPERFWNYFVDGEGLGLFSALAETDRPIMQSLTPAILQNGQKIIGATSLVIQGTFANDTPGQREVLLKEAGRQLIQAVPIANDIVSSITKRTNKETLTRFKTFRQKQGAYKSDILGTDYSTRASFSPAVTKSLMYKQLQANLYSDRTPEEKTKDFYAAVSYLQHQYEMSNTTRISKDKAYSYAFKRALSYLEDSKPITLSQKKTQGKTSSDYNDFTARLTNKELMELKTLEQVYGVKYKEMRLAILKQKNKYRP